jgi:Fe-S cluster assembly iron-binding protein IscA
MLTVTEDAKQYLKDTLLAHTDDTEMGLRLVLESAGRLGLVLDREGVGDQIVEHEGAKVLLVEPELAPVVDGITLDVQDTANGTKLVVTKE